MIGSVCLVSALSEIDEHHRARVICEATWYASPLELDAEQIDPRTGRYLVQFLAGIHPSRAQKRSHARD